MKPTINRYSLFVASLSVFAVHTVTAANSFYAPGDLVLFFQKEGSSNTIYANLGNAATQFRGAAAGVNPTGAADAPVQFNFLNLNTTLTSAFGAGWTNDPNVYAGLAGVFGTSQTNNTVTNGDPHRTLYISSGRDTVGPSGSSNSVGWDLTLAGNTAMTTAATGIQTQNNAFENNYDALTTVSLTSISQIDEQNPLVIAGIPPVTSQGNAMGNTLQGGIQQRGTDGDFGTYDTAGQAEFALDLYRIVAKTGLPGEVPWNLRQGSYEGTVIVNSFGQVSFIPEPSSLALVGFGAGSLLLRRRRSA
jgi:hypothetical protein